MNSSTFFNKVGITLFSTLTSIMSGINHLMAHDQQAPQAFEPSGRLASVVSAPLDVRLPERPFASRWESIKQAFLSFLFWVILGLAAGFLIGMIRGG